MDERQSLWMVEGRIKKRTVDSIHTIMLSHLDKYKILLASNSPRRRELLAGLGIAYQVTALPDVDESYPLHLQGCEIPSHISKIKADAYRHAMDKNTLLITADTIVWLEGKVYGKPNNKEEAIAMLQALSGREHEVITGVTLTTTTQQTTFTASTFVAFTTLTQEEIVHYVDHYQPLDKAGSYGIQEWIGFIGVKGIRGSYFNVMGLPVQQLYQQLKKIK